MYIAEQQNCLTVLRVLAESDLCWVPTTGIGTYPPKPPPLVELQRNPPGLRFFYSLMLHGNIIAAKMFDCLFFDQSN